MSKERSSPQRTMTEKYRDLQLYKWKCENEKMEKSDALNDFENYIMSEYELKNPIKTKYTHNINVKSTKGKIHTHTQCVLHIIRLRLIIFHTPKNFHGRNKIE